MATDRPAIPEPIKREIRQRCGFGCVICGLPLYEYEHMEGWAQVHRHVAAEITLLCDRHHREKTNGLLPLAEVREADRNPHNKRAGVSPLYGLHFAGNTCQIVAGTMIFDRTGLVEGSQLVALSIDRTPLLAFTFEQSHLFLTIQMFDDQDRKVLWIERNELRYCVTPWDIRFEGRTLSVRERQRHYLLEVVLDPPSRIIVRRGRFSLNGLEVLISPMLLCYANTNAYFSGLRFSGHDAAIMVGAPLVEGPGGGLILPAANRGNPSREAAEEWMREISREAAEQFSAVGGGLDRSGFGAKMPTFLARTAEQAPDKPIPPARAPEVPGDQGETSPKSE